VEIKIHLKKGVWPRDLEEQEDKNERRRRVRNWRRWNEDEKDLRTQTFNSASLLRLSVEEIKRELMLACDVTRERLRQSQGRDRRVTME
jgi:hypothetical protein